MVNPYAILAALVLALGGAIGSFFFGVNVGADREVAGQARKEKLIAEVSEAAQQGAARAISEIRITNTTQRQVIEREIRNVPDYSACKHSPDGLRAVNSAIENRADGAGGGGVPEAVAAD